MDYTKDIQLALLYIENNLTGDLSSKEIAKKAGMSEFHFQRVFKNNWAWEYINIFKKTYGPCFPTTFEERIEDYRNCSDQRFFLTRGVFQSF